MGSRINYVLVEPGGHRIFYSHWGALSVERDVFWGPAATLRFIDSQEPAEGLLDDVWAEGGVLLDTTRRELVLWGGEELHADVPLRRLYMHLLARMWPDWQLRWAHEGILDLSRRIGVPDTEVLERDPDSDLGVGGPAAPSLVRTIATVIRPEGHLTVHALGSTPPQTLLGGPAMLETIDARPTTRPLERLDVVWEEDSWLDGGVHLDLTARTLAFWCVRDVSHLAVIRARWPGWTIDFLGDRFEDHLTAAGERVTITTRPRDQLIATLREILMRNLDRPSPARAIAAALAEKHERVEINPHALADHFGPELGDDDRREILDLLFEKFRN
jgi:hypothetical protein